MSLYCIGDLQGCAAPFGRLLDRIGFSPSRDTLCLLGDLVNRGPDSLAVLRQISALGDAAQSVLGNHDLHLLAVAAGAKKTGGKDTLQAVLDAPDREALLDWLRHRPLAISASGWLMVHAGVLPQWTVSQTLGLAGEVERALRQPGLHDFLMQMYGNRPDRWHDSLTGADRLRVIVNALTRLRFCTEQGVMEFDAKKGADAAPDGFLPWFDVPGRRSAETPIAFGHWSALVSDRIVGSSGFNGLRNNTLALDTGCVWGNRLTAARLGPKDGDFELISEPCLDQSTPASGMD
jgi:bis(5'-nucleosyl)-tetraphosphatase (symmetrical)